MVNLSFINPLSFEGQEIIKEFGDLNNIFNENKQLINNIIHTTNQKISDDSLIPKSCKDLAIKRIQWSIEQKNNKDYNPNEFQYLLNDNIYKEDVVSYHILSQAIANTFNLTSRETRLFIEYQGKLIEDRLKKISPSLRSEIIDDVLSEELDDGTIKWTQLKELVASKKLFLTDLLISNGEIIIEKEDFLEKFSNEFKDRSPERMYEILIGDSIKELIISRIIMQKTEDYLKRIKEMSKTIEIHPAIKEIGEELKKFIPEEIGKYSSFYGGSGGIYGSVKGGKLIHDAFPPCIKNTIKGVSSGGRNDAIVLLLTSFISYARLYPSIFSSEESIKVSDMDPNLTITENEILPIIYEAADNCSPPLFDDQPEEKINIISKLGFGMHSTVNIDHEGETKWYTPMSCEKIKIHLPQLCKPDKDCKGINNPLSCYVRKKYSLNKKNEES